jgi:muramoyltetrapeptide carboxypeptidase
LRRNLFEKDNQFSGTVEQRTADLQSMIDNDAIKAILCARGGYGTVQIIDSIDFSNLRNNSKWIVGYSDVTVLHSHLHNLGFASLHATMPINVKTNTKESLESLRNSLFGIEKSIKCKAHPFNRFGKIEADMVGGNLSILYSLLGSNSEINTDGKILFIEFKHNKLYKIDRFPPTISASIFPNLLNGWALHLILFSIPKREFLNDSKLSFVFVLTFIGIVACRLAKPKLCK